MNIDEVSKQFAVHLGVAGSLHEQLTADARLHGMTVFEVDLSGLTDVTALCRYLESEFMYPFPTAGLDAAISLISDLEWFGNPKGYVVVARGANDSSPIAEDFVSILPNILDRWRAQAVPFIVAVEEKGERLRDALADANAFMERAGRWAWAQPGTGPVEVVFHPTGCELNV